MVLLVTQVAKGPGLIMSQEAKVCSEKDPESQPAPDPVIKHHLTLRPALPPPSRGNVFKEGVATAINTTSETARALASAPPATSRLDAFENILPTCHPARRAQDCASASVEGRALAFLLLVGVAGQLLKHPSCKWPGSSQTHC